MTSTGAGTLKWLTDQTTAVQASQLVAGDVKSRESEVIEHVLG